MANPRTLFQVLDEAAAQFGKAPALHQPYLESGRRRHKTWTWIEFRDTAKEIACGLRSLGYGKGDIVALCSETRAEFYLADFGILANGSVAAALYTNYPAPDLVRTVEQCDAKALFVEDVKTLQAMSTAGVQQFFLLSGEAEGAMTLEELRRRGRDALAHDPELFDRIRAGIAPADDAVLYLTSGATGEPKMAMTSHYSIVSNIDMGPSVLPMTPQDRTVAWLPSAHIAQRVVIEFLPVRCGMPVYFAESLMKLPQEIKAVRPTIFLAPPRMWERVYTTICADINKRPAYVRKVFYAALGLGLKASEYRQRGEAVPPFLKAPLALADRAIFSKIRERLGGELHTAASGAAPLGKDLAAFYDAIGLTLKEGYGLTEGGVAALNPLARPKAGSIGKPLPGVQILIAEDGELLIKSPALFSRYYKDPVVTAQVLRDGTLHTGDAGYIDDEGYVYITGRKKEMIVSSTGKKVFPARVEAIVKMEPLIAQVLLVGDRLPYVTALLSVNPQVAESLKGMEAMKGKPLAEVVKSKPVVAEVSKAIKRVNRNLAPFEQIRKFRVLERDLTIENGELTATMKVRRAKVMENFRKEIEELYAGKEDNL
jgi:long-chain acyl-CoA synthetase